MPRYLMQAKGHYSTTRIQLRTGLASGPMPYLFTTMGLWGCRQSRDTLREVGMRALITMSGTHLSQRRVLRAVATLEFFKGIFVLAMGICALLLLHKDLWLYAESLLARLHIDTDRHFAQVFLDFADNITDARLWAAARIAFAYAALRFTEGYGLWRHRTWAEWVAFLSGTLLLPLEVREVVRAATLIRVGFLVGNVAIVLYMLSVILTNRRERKRIEGTAKPEPDNDSSGFQSGNPETQGS